MAPQARTYFNIVTLISYATTPTIQSTSKKIRQTQPDTGTPTPQLGRGRSVGDVAEPTPTIKPKTLQVKCIINIRFL